MKGSDLVSVRELDRKTKQRKKLGYRWVVEAKIGGKRLLKKGGQNVSDGDARIVIRSTQEIGMFYGLNLFKHNRFAKKMMIVLEGDDSRRYWKKLFGALDEHTQN